MQARLGDDPQNQWAASARPLKVCLLTVRAVVSCVTHLFETYALCCIASSNLMNSQSTPMLLILPISSASTGWFLVIVLGYALKSLLLQYVFYYRGQNEVAVWKTQPGDMAGVGQLFGLPGISSKPDRQPYHRLFTSFNLLMAGLFAAGTSEICIRGQCRMSDLSLSSLTDGSGRLMEVFGGLFISICFEIVAEYYWHRAMHSRFFYAHLHRFHHAYRAPSVYDDMYIHPLEAFGYYCILYAPPFLFPLPLPSFLLYMGVMGICGVLDHSGIKIRLPGGIYNTADHDLHHERVHVNYGFPFMIMDHLHGTYLSPAKRRKTAA